VTLLGVALRTFDPRVVHAFAPAGAQLGYSFGQLTPFHPVAVAPGDTVWVALTERVISLGATRLSDLPDAVELADPYGNEFGLHSD
jgi:hypothetical protein